MEYVALFVWLAVCVVLGGLMHSILRTAFEFKFIRILAAPGIAVRKLAMAVAALVSGASVTQVNVYDLSDRDIGFRGEGVASVSKVFVPLAPLFACAVALQTVNVLLGNPVSLDYPPPPVESLDAGGVRVFIMGMWTLLSGLVTQAFQIDWGSLNLYVLLAFVLSLSLGACVSFQKIREAILGALLLVVGLAVVCALFGVRSGLGTGAPGTLASSPAADWVRSLREFVIRTAGAAFIMMLCGLMVAIAVGVGIRIYELATAAVGGKGKSGKSSGQGERRLAA